MPSSRNDVNPGWDAGAEEVAIPDNIWPVCSAGQDRFAGVFDGQGHSISGIYLFSDAERAGIFGTTGDGNVGGLIGVNRQHMKVENCISAGSIEITTATFGSIGSVFGLLTGSAVTSLKNNLYTGDLLGSDVYIPAEGDLLIQILDTAALKGSAAEALLTANSLTEWSVTEAGYPLPTTVKDMIGSVEVPAYEPGVGVVIPDEPTTPGEGEGEGETNAPETNAPETNATTTTAAAEEESGCTSVVFGGLATMLLIAGAAVTVVKKKD